MPSPADSPLSPVSPDAATSERATGAGPQAAPGARRAGLIQAVLAYSLWGFLPIYFIALAPTSSFEIVAWRIVLSLVFCALLLVVTRSVRPFLTLLMRPRVSLTMALAGVMIYANWQIYVYGTLSGQVLEAALGYFINPIVTVFLGVFFLRERLRPAQWAAVGISIVAVVVMVAGSGRVPWIALALAFSFGIYGFIKKRVGGTVDAVAGLSMETLWLLPVALVQLAVVGMTTGLTIGTISTAHTVLLLAAGAATAVPLLLFAAASRRLPLTYMGFIQYFAPVIQFVVGLLILHEPMPPERWAGFGLIWLALVVLSVDGLLAGRSARRSAVAAPV